MLDVSDVRWMSGEKNEQSEDFGCITSLYAVSLALPSIACDDREVCTSNGKDGTAVLGVRVERTLLWVSVRTVWHDCYEY